MPHKQLKQSAHRLQKGASEADRQQTNRRQRSLHDIVQTPSSTWTEDDVTMLQRTLGNQATLELLNSHQPSGHQTPKAPIQRNFAETLEFWKKMEGQGGNQEESGLPDDLDLSDFDLSDLPDDLGEQVESDNPGAMLAMISLTLNDMS